MICWDQEDQSEIKKPATSNVEDCPSAVFEFNFMQNY